MESKAKLEAIRAQEGAKLRQNGKDLVNPAMAAVIEAAPEGSKLKAAWEVLQTELQANLPTGQAASTGPEDYEMVLPEVESDSESDDDDSDEDIIIGEKQSKADFNAEQKKKKEAAKVKRDERKEKQRKRKEQNGQMRAALKGVREKRAPQKEINSQSPSKSRFKRNYFRKAVYILLLTMAERSFPHGVAANYVAPFSGQLNAKTIEASLATLPSSVIEMTNKWNSINSSRTSGLLPLCEQGPLDDAVRNGVWEPELQVKMPTMGGLPGSRGKRIEWPHGNSVSHIKK